MYVGAIRGGPETSWDSGMCGAIKAAGRVLDDLRPPDGSIGLIDLVMHMPGSVVTVTFHGIRTGIFSKRGKILQIQVAVPEEHVNGPGAGQFLVTSMRDAVKLAERRFLKSGIEFDSAANLDWVGEVESALLSETIA